MIGSFVIVHYRQSFENIGVGIKWWVEALKTEIVIDNRVESISGGLSDEVIDQKAQSPVFVASNHSGSADTSNTIPPNEIKDYITEWSDFFDVDVELALKIAECETHFRNICNEKYGCIAGIGPLQLVTSTFIETTGRIEAEYGGVIGDPDVYNYKHNILHGLFLQSKAEYWRWESTHKCWSSEYGRLQLTQ